MQAAKIATTNFEIFFFASCSPAVPDAKVGRDFKQLLSKLNVFSDGAYHISNGKFLILFLLKFAVCKFGISNTFLGTLFNLFPDMSSVSRLAQFQFGVNMDGGSSSRFSFDDVVATGRSVSSLSDIFNDFNEGI